MSALSVRGINLSFWYFYKISNFGKMCNLGRRIYRFAASASGVIALLVILWGCTANDFNAGAIAWKTYSNSRYGFEFPYPSNWTSSAAPANGDGIAFISQQDNSVEIRGWASHELPNSIVTEQEPLKKIKFNFKTAQGVSGVMVVEVDKDIGSMTLTLTQSQVKYCWQGRSKSQKFQDYYRLFYYIAQQYRIPKS
ncbi:hypothetical protein [Nostoc sp. 'Peltigera membranacea cyanobiont' N6]|uniref:hypothetical protein n=1 Tax=Nostoc sp. 'Peltigera membranacea cyanobiont' N6 TaxID=1261031 RepID=UPI000D0C7066|nr:hypothetical protein [Nostoc sp. 'Peltigera membranacea cyanobiont' N6]AVH65581.1 hypothetical protein NPM_4025 [Nostoc sp. 'Peltigera membranacea cyanobiont' N6]